MGGWKCWQEAKELLPETGIYLDTAFALGEMQPAPDAYRWKKEDLQLLREDEFLGLLEAFGTDRVLFGTDSPWADPETEVRKIKSLPLSRTEISRILVDNAERLLLEAGARL